MENETFPRAETKERELGQKRPCRHRGFKEREKFCTVTVRQVWRDLVVGLGVTSRGQETERERESQRKRQNVCVCLPSSESSSIPGSRTQIHYFYYNCRL